MLSLRKNVCQRSAYLLWKRPSVGYACFLKSSYGRRKLGKCACFPVVLCLLIINDRGFVGVSSSLFFFSSSFFHSSALQDAGHNSGCAQRVLRVEDMQIDPLNPPKFRHKRVPAAGSGSPPPPVLHSPTSTNNWKTTGGKRQTKEDRW